MTRSRSTHRAALAGALTVLSLLGGPLATPGHAARPQQRAAANPAVTYAADAVTATQKARVANKLARLGQTGCLHDLAVAQAKRMAASRTTYRQNLSAVLRTCNLNYAGENVAYGFPTGTDVVNYGFMRSAGLRANIVNKKFTMVGVAARRDVNGVWYISEVLGGR